MLPEWKLIAVTGATGGIGAALARELAGQGHSLVLSGRRAGALHALASELQGAQVRAVVDSDLNDESCRAEFTRRCRQLGVNVLVNALGVNEACMFGEQNAAGIERIIHTNLITPMLLARALLPTFIAHGTGLIVNVGSAYGAIGHPGYAAYGASKFGLRGFTEALHRELIGTGVRAIYVAPRAVATPMNAGRSAALNAALGASVDDPVDVAHKIVQAMQSGRARTCIGWPERAFVALNQVAPALVDRALGRKLPLIRATLADDATLTSTQPEGISR